MTEGSEASDAVEAQDDAVSPSPGGCVTVWATAMIAFALYFFIRVILQVVADSPTPETAGLAARGFLCLGFGLQALVRSESWKNRILITTGLPCLALFGYQAHAIGGELWTAFRLVVGIGALLFIVVRLRLWRKRGRR